MTYQDSICCQLVKQARSRRQRESSRMHKGASGHQDLGQVATDGRGGGGGVPYQALPLLRIFAYEIRARKKVRKGEGEPGGRLFSTVLALVLAPALVSYN